MQCLGSHVGLYFATVYICIYEMFITLVVPGANVNKNTNYDTSKNYKVTVSRAFVQKLILHLK
jgi:hypothetical protein